MHSESFARNESIVIEEPSRSCGLGALQKLTVQDRSTTASGDFARHALSSVNRAPLVEAARARTWVALGADAAVGETPALAWRPVAGERDRAVAGTGDGNASRGTGDVRSVSRSGGRVDRRAGERGDAMSRPVAATIALLLCSVPMFAQAQAPAGPPGTVRYYHGDALGSIRAVTDANGNVVARHDYFPFGDEPGNAPNPAAQRFTGQQRDRESGMDYFGARYYMQRPGRFTTADPGHVGGDTIDPQSWNAYAYARNNPLRFVDPTGRDYEVHYGDGSVAYLTDAQFYGLFGYGVFFDGNLGSEGNIYINNDPNHVFGTFRHYYGFSDAIRGAGNSAAQRIKEGIQEMAINAAAGVLIGSARWGVEAGVASLEAAEIASAARLGALTKHAAGQLLLRGITPGDVNTAIKSARAAGQVITKTSQYGTPQKLYNGANGITVVVEQSGRNAGKVVTAFRTGTR